MRSMNIGIYVIGTLNQQPLRGSYTEIKFSKHKAVSGKTPLFVIGLFRSFYSFSLKIAF